MGRGQDKSRLDGGLVHQSHVAVGAVRLPGRVGSGVAKTKASHTLDHQVLASQGSRLVEAGHVDATGKRNAERLGAKDGVLGKGCQTGVDGKTQLHGKLGRHDAGDYEDAVEEELGSLAVLA